MTGVGFRYDAQAVDQMKAATNRLYEIWLELATKHTTDQGRERLMPVDVDAARAEAINRWIVGSR